MRDEIAKYLGTVAHSTARTIADKIGSDRLDVARELNSMHGDAIVEREKRQGSNEYLYWLSQGDAVAKLEEVIGAPTMGHVSGDPVTPLVAEAKPEVSSGKLDAELTALRAEVFDLKASNANRQNKIRDLEARCATQTETIRQREADHDEIRIRLTQERDEARQEAKKLTSKCKMLQIQLDEYDERGRFEAWFRSHPEWSGESDVTKARMLEAWLERSRVLEVEL